MGTPAQDGGPPSRDDPDFSEWWEQFGLLLVAGGRLNTESLMLAAFIAGKATEAREAVSRRVGVRVKKTPLAVAQRIASRHETGTLFAISRDGQTIWVYHEGNSGPTKYSSLFWEVSSSSTAHTGTPAQKDA